MSSEKYNNENNNKIEKLKDKDKIIKAAEVLGYISSKNKKSYSDKDINNILNELERNHSEEVIDQAFKVASLREKKFDFKKFLLGKNPKSNDGGGENASANESVEDDEKLKNLDEEYKKNLITLKKLLLEEEFKKLQSKPEYEGDDEKINQALRDYDVKILLPLINSEFQRDLEKKKELLALESSQKIGFFNRICYKFLALPRTTKAVIGALVGGAVSAFFLNISLTAVPVYFGYRVLRSVVGGVFGVALQKIIGNRVVEGVFKKDFEKLQNEISNLLLKEEEVGDKTFKTKILKKEEVEEIKKYNPQIQELIEKRNFERLAEVNYEIAEKNSEKINQLLKCRSRNYKVVSLSLGLLGGILGGKIFDSFLGPMIFDISNTRANVDNKVNNSNNTDNVVENNNFVEKQIESGSGDINKINPDWYVKKGEGVEHVFKRQLLSNPEFFGYKQEFGDVKIWANKMAHIIAIKNGYFNPINGQEIRVFDFSYKGGANPVYELFLDKDGQIKVREFFENKEIESGSNNINSYEYEYFDEYLFDKNNSNLKPSNIILEQGLEKKTGIGLENQEINVNNNLYDNYLKDLGDWYFNIKNRTMGDIINMLNDKTGFWNQEFINTLNNFFEKNKINVSNLSEEDKLLIFDDFFKKITQK